MDELSAPVFLAITVIPVLLCRIPNSRNAVLCSILALASGCSAPLLTDSSESPFTGSGAASQNAGVEALKMSVQDSVLQVGESSRLEVTDTVVTALVRRRFFSPKLRFSSSDTTVATINSNGVVLARGLGSAGLTAELDGRTGTRTVRVTAPPAPPTGEDPSPPLPDPPSPPADGTVPDLKLPADNPAELPRLDVDLPRSTVGGKVIRVPTGGRVQQAIDAASPGDVILLEKGAIFTESIRLRKKQGDGWITIRTDGMATPEGIRVGLRDTLNFAQINSAAANTPAISTDEGASGYWLINLDIALPTGPGSTNTLVNLSAPQQTAIAQVPSRIVLDRVIVRGRPNRTLRRCISLQSANSAVLNSVIVECHEKGADSQAIAGWNGPGPYLIHNNLLEGAGENVMFGGADPSIPGLVPSDIILSWNHFRKPSSWYLSGLWTVKNLFELKLGIRVLVHHNYFESHWADAQAGWAIGMVSVNQGGAAPWSQTADITFVDNVIANSAAGINLNPTGGFAALRMQRLLFHRNILLRLGEFSDFGGSGRPFQVLGGISNLHFSENTIIGGSHSALYLPMDGNPPKGSNFKYSRNISNHGLYGVFGSGSGVQSMLARYSSFEFADNCLFEAPTTTSPYYPAGNRLVSGSRNVLFPSLLAGDVSMSTESGCDSTLPSGVKIGAPSSLLQQVMSGASSRVF